MKNQLITDCYDYAAISATTNVATVGGAAASYGYLAGIFVSSVTGGSITVYDEPGAGTTNLLVATFTPVASTFYRIPAKYLTGCNVVITGTVACTVFYSRP